MPNMVKLHARVTVEVEVPESALVSLVSENMNNGDLSDVDLTEDDVRYFLSCGKVAKDWDDYGYIPSNWLTFDAVYSGLYDADEFGVRSVQNEE